MNSLTPASARRIASFRADDETQNRISELAEKFPEDRSLVTPLHVEHIVARKHRGSTHQANLALACHHCNLFKSSSIAGIDTRTNAITRLFHPRRHLWPHHFRWENILILGRTAIGRTTVDVLAMNSPERLDLRIGLMHEGEFPW